LTADPFLDRDPLAARDLQQETGRVSLVTIRKAFPYLAFATLAAALIYATSFGTLPPADLTFNNYTEIKTVDPPKATGEPEGRVIEALFEGLLRRLPDPDAPPPTNRTNTPYTPQYATADRMEVSDDGRVYTFHIRESARWSDGTPITAHDFAWSWLRMLHPGTASEYAYQLHYIVGARNFNKGEVKVRDKVEVELPDRPMMAQMFPRGTIVRGVLRETHRPKNTTDENLIRNGTVYVVDTNGQRRAFALQPQRATYAGSLRIEPMRFILPDFEATVGIEARDDRTLVVTLDNRTPYFPDLVAFYPLYPTQRANVERFGEPDFTRAENLVTNGPYVMQFRRIRDRIRLVKNPHYWNAENVQLEVIDAMAISSDIAALNMYETGQLDWIPNVPPTVIPDLMERDDFHSAPILSVYFYRVNTTRKPMDDERVRQALNLAIDKAKICKHILRAGELPATSLVPPALPGYEPPEGMEFNVTEARRLLSEAGYPNGHNFPRIEILYNTHETHQAVAEVIQDDWKRNLGIRVDLRTLEWGTYLETQRTLQYQVSRAGWSADYGDPNTFLDMFVTGGANNQTGWSNKRYDELVYGAAAETDPERRLAMLREAEEIFIDKLPILPIAFSVSKDMVRPHVRGFSSNALKVHPLHIMSIDKELRDNPPSSSVVPEAQGAAR
jgi:oligopeptide transport system substrate-binding protein